MFNDSPMRAALNSKPGNLYKLSGHPTARNDETNPTLFRSIRRGATARTYVHVQMKRRITRSNDWKLKSADWPCDEVRLGLGSSSSAVLTMMRQTACRVVIGLSLAPGSAS